MGSRRQGIAGVARRLVRSRSIGRPGSAVHGGGAIAAAVGVGLFVGACQVPDTGRSPPEALPSAAVSYLRPDTLRTVRVDPGVVYRYAWSPLGPWAVHLLQADLGRQCDLELGVLRAEEREAGAGGLERVTSMVGRSPERVLAAVNADFFTSQGTAVGTELNGGVVTALATRPTIAWSLGQPPWIGTAEVSGDSVHLGWPVSLVEGDGLTEAVGGFPELLDRGERVGDLEVSARPSFAAARHPRTAVGYDPENGWAWLAVVDGRQPPFSDGMTLPELADLFEALGATEAINLDGGGSSVMVVGGTAMNRPSDLAGERPVVNALALLRSPRGCALSD